MSESALAHELPTLRVRTELPEDLPRP
jgi:hypothetical protein